MGPGRPGCQQVVHPVDGIPDLVKTERLPDDQIDAVFDHPGLRVTPLPARYRHDSQTRLIAARRDRQVPPVHLRQAEIGDQQFNRFFFDPGQCRLGVLGGGHGIPGQGEQFVHYLTDAGVVIDDQDFLNTIRRRGHGPFSRCQPAPAGWNPVLFRLF